MVVRALGRQYSVLRPSLYLWIFCVADLVAIVVQAIGGAMAALALQDGKSSESGTHIMVAGIAFQLACMIAFSGLALDVYRRARRDRSYRSRPHAQEGRLTRVGWGLAWATGWIIVRGIYRTVELAEGWTGYLISAFRPPDNALRRPHSPIRSAPVGTQRTSPTLPSSTRWRWSCVRPSSASPGPPKRDPLLSSGASRTTRSRLRRRHRPRGARARRRCSPYSVFSFLLDLSDFSVSLP